VLPKPVFDSFLRRIGKEWATGEYMNLFSRSDLGRLLSEAGVDRPTIIRNRFLGFTMTYTVIWNKHL
jgi:hypothetical protein